MLGTIQRKPSELGLAEKTIVLSFDDGPVPEGQTETLVNYLDEENIKAAFCLVGARVRGNENTIRKMQHSGHLIVNHGFLHKMPEQMTDEEFHDDLGLFDRTIGQALGQEQWASEYYRPPGGRWTKAIANRVSGHGKKLYPITFFAWDMVPFPFRKPLTRKWMLRHLEKESAGLFLLHEAVVPLGGEKQPPPPRGGRTWILEMLREFVPMARSLGYQFVEPTEFLLSEN